MNTIVIGPPTGRKTAIVVLNWNGAADTMACVRSLFGLRGARPEIIICDNASRPESWQALLTLGQEHPGDFRAFDSLAAALADPRPRSRVTLIQTGANLGYAGGMNVGMRYALADPELARCWVLNNDTEVHPDALAHLHARMDEDPRIGICGASLVVHDDRERVQAFGGARYNAARARSAAIGFHARVQDIPASPEAVEAELAYVNGASMLVSRRYLEEVGLMDERYFLYSEEHDWAQRGKGRFKLGYAPRAIVYHKHGATIGTSSSGGSPLSLFYLFRSKLMFVARHEWWLLPVALPSLVLEALKFAAKGHALKAAAALKGLLAVGVPTLRPPVKRP